MKKKIFISMPCYAGQIYIRSAISLFKFIKDHGSPNLDAEVHLNMLPGESHVNRARNRLAKMFLNTDCTHMIWIDQDIIFESANIDQLLARDCEVVGGLYPKKELGDPQWVINLIDGKNEPDETGLIEVRYAGTGFLLVSRVVLEKMIAANAERQEKNKPMLAFTKNYLNAEDQAYLEKLIDHDNIEYTDDSAGNMGTCWNFFHAGPKHGRWISEDWHFCHVHRDLGGKVFADTRVQLGHTGTIDYPIRMPLGGQEQEIRP